MNAAISFQISIGIIAFGIWTAAGTTDSSAPLACALMGLLTVIVNNSRSQNRLVAPSVRASARAARGVRGRHLQWQRSSRACGMSYLNCQGAKRKHARVTETFPNKREAKKFAKTKLVDTPSVSAKPARSNSKSALKPAKGGFQAG